MAEEELQQLPQYESDDEDAEQAVAKQSGKDEKGHIGVTAANFRDFLLKAEILRAITDCAFEHPSKVQEEAIPEALSGNDIVAQAKSGMGKTAVFTIVVLERLKIEDGLSALVLVHTRELCHQITQEFDRFKKYLKDIKVMSLYGGVDARAQRQAIRDDPPNIVVACPGRLHQLVMDKTLNLGNIKMFVIDEVDKVLEKADMRQHVQEVFYKTPRNKQTMMFSATLAKDMRTIVSKFVQNPKMILLEEAKLTLHGLRQYYVRLDEAAKTRKLMDLMDALDFNQVMIFVKTTARAHSLNKLLQECNFPSTELHGNLKAEERISTYNKFKKFERRIMVSTDLAGRGIDIEKVNIVFNYDFPSVPEGEDPATAADSYLHRVGRAGRFGNRGLSISFVSSPEDEKVFELVQERFKVKVEELPDEIDTSTYMPRAGVKEQLDE